MAIMLPGELDYALDLLGYDWPNVDEDAIREGADLVRNLADELQGTLDSLDRFVNYDLSEAFESKAALAYIEGFTNNRTQNMDTAIALLPGVADGMDLAADGIVALKTKVIAEVSLTVGQIAAAAATAVVTLGASVAVNAGIILARKKALDILTDIAVEQMLTLVLEQVSGPIIETVAALGQAMLDAPLTSGGGEQPKFDVSYDLMEQLADAIQDCGDDQKDIIDTFVSRFTSLPITAE